MFFIITVVPCVLPPAALRKLTAKRRNVEGKLECRDIIRDYTDYSSQTYAPLSRMGLFLDRPSQSHVVRSRYHDTYEGWKQVTLFRVRPHGLYVG